MSIWFNISQVRWMREILSWIQQPNKLAWKASDRSADDWQYQTHITNYHNFTCVQWRLFLGLEILVEHCSLDNKRDLHMHHNVQMTNIGPACPTWAQYTWLLNEFTFPQKLDLRKLPNPIVKYCTISVLNPFNPKLISM